MGYVSRINKIVASEYDENFEVAKYMWFVVKSDGTIWCGNEYRSDAVDAWKETKESDPNAKLISRVKMDKEKLHKWFKEQGLSDAIIEKGLKAIKLERKESRDSNMKSMTVR